jgi:hypothetical protein
LFKGINAADLLEDVLRRFRPYAEDKPALDALKQTRLEILGQVIAGGGKTEDLRQWGRETVAAFQSAPLRYHERFPLVLYIGEIYMRQHDPYTDFVIRRLEEAKLEVVRDPVTDWLLYVNKMNRRNAKRDASLGWSDRDFGRAVRSARKLGNTILKGAYMAHVADKLAEPFHEVLAGRHVLPHPMEIIETLERAHETNGAIEGESPLSTGIAYYFMHDMVHPHGDGTAPHATFGVGEAPYISGIFHIGPFTCMQEGVATAKIEAMVKEFRKTKPDLVFPIIHAFFGDSPNANIAAEIAVFQEQCYQKRDLLREKHAGAGHHSHDIRGLNPKHQARNSKQIPNPKS